MKTICLVFILLFGVSVFAKITPEEKYQIIHRHFLEALREKIKIPPASLQRGSTPAHLKKDRNSIQSFLEDPISDGTHPESEIHAAINPADSTNIVVGDMRQDPTSLTSLLTFPIYYTTDFGNTWGQSSFSGDSPIPGLTRIGGGDPMFVFDIGGKNLYFTSIDMGINGFSLSTIYETIWLARSTDGGMSFTASENSFLVTDTLTSLFGGGIVVDKEWMTIDRSHSSNRGTIYASYLSINSTDTTESLSVSRIIPGTTNFTTTTTTVPTNDILFKQIATLDVDNSGNVHMTFFGSPDEKVFYVYHSVSVDGGLTFSVPNIVSRAEVAHQSATSYQTYIPGIDTGRQFPSVQVACGRSGAPNANDVYCIWEALGTTKAGPSGDDIYFSYSNDNGTSWSTPLVVNHDQPGLGRHQFRPSVFVNSRGVIVAGWYDGRAADANTSVDYYVSYSFDGGKTFIGETKVSAQSTDFTTVEDLIPSFGIGEYLQVLASDYTGIPIWTDGRTNDGNLNIMSAFSPIAPASKVERMQSVTSGLNITSITPNPANEKIDVSFRMNLQSSVSISLINMLGEKILSTSPEIYESGLHTITLPLLHLSSGNYILRVDAAGGFADRTLNIVR